MKVRISIKWGLGVAALSALVWWLNTRPPFIEAEGTGITRKEALAAAYNEVTTGFQVEVQIQTTSNFSIDKKVVNEFTQQVRQRSEAKLVGVTASKCITDTIGLCKLTVRVNLRTIGEVYLNSLERKAKQINQMLLEAAKAIDSKKLQYYEQIQIELSDFLVFEKLTDYTVILNDSATMTKRFSDIKSPPITKGQLQEKIDQLKAKPTNDMMLTTLLLNRQLTNKLTGLVSICPIYRQSGGYLPVTHPILSNLNNSVSADTSNIATNQLLVARASRQKQNSTLIEWFLSQTDGSYEKVAATPVRIPQSDWKTPKSSGQQVLLDIEQPQYTDTNGQRVNGVDYTTTAITQQIPKLFKQADYVSWIEPQPCIPETIFEAKYLVRHYAVDYWLRVKNQAQIAVYTEVEGNNTVYNAVTDISVTIVDSNHILKNAVWTSQGKIALYDNNIKSLIEYSNQDALTKLIELYGGRL